VNHSAGPLADGCEPGREILSSPWPWDALGDAGLAAWARTVLFACTPADASRDIVRARVAIRFMSVLLRVRNGFERLKTMAEPG
jgi:hypothetical protein